MNNKIDTEKIRGLLEKALDWMVWIEKRNKCTCEPNCRCVKCVVIDDIVLFDQALSLLPPPCEKACLCKWYPESCDDCSGELFEQKTCGGSGEIKVGEVGDFGAFTPCPGCPACQALHQNGTGQAPVGKVEELIKEGREHYLFPLHGKFSVVKKWIDQACTHLEAQAKQKAEAVAARVEAENECCVLRGQIKQLEAGKIELLKDYIAVNQGKMSQLFFCKKHNVSYQEFIEIAYVIGADLEAKVVQLEELAKDLEWGINITGNSVKVVMDRVNELKAEDQALQEKGE